MNRIDGKPRETPAEPSRLLTIRVSGPFRRWAQAEASQEGLTVAGLVERSLAELAARAGRPGPPARNETKGGTVDGSPGSR